MEELKAPKLNIAKEHIHIIVDVLQAYGVHRAVVSPGSRNAPVVVALERAGFELTMVIDERTAGFVALGMALRTGELVALCCTSGSAVLNYAPALAEAYYRRIPLIVLTADRPYYSVDQRDGQTIRQTEALTSVSRCCVDVREDMKAGIVNRLANKALWAATAPLPGPVQINIQLSVPLTPIAVESPGRPRGFRIRNVRTTLPGEDMERVINEIKAASSVVLVNAALTPDSALDTAIKRIGGYLLCFSEIFSGAPTAFPTSFITDGPGVTPPELALVIGGPVVSDKLKVWLRGARRVISIGFDDEPVDTFRNLTACVQMEPAHFLDLIPDELPVSSDYFQKESTSIAESLPAVLNDRLFNGIFSALQDTTCNIVLSNGMTIRRACRAVRPAGTVYANRGVSGIDGVSSTAVGIHLADPDHLTLLITGDMSAAYDIGALAVHGLGDNFKIIVINNGGGDIFRRVATTATLPERDRYFVAAPRLPLKELATAYGFDYQLYVPEEIGTAMHVLLSNPNSIIIEIKENKEI